jgi:hypothetical protein
MSSFEVLDWIVLVLYFIAVFGIAFFVFFRQRKSKRPLDGEAEQGQENNDEASNYFLAGRHAPWWAVGCTLVMS